MTARAAVASALLAALLVALPACTADRTHADQLSPARSSAAALDPAASPVVSGDASASSSSSPPASFGAGPAWPRVSRSAPPAAYGAVVTNRIAAIGGPAGGTLAAGLLLPRLDGDQLFPLV
ncbi:MAG: hypothetical protein ABI912_00180, partial [Actinomycetota bacterium]